MIKISNLTYYYPNLKKPALSDVSLEIQDGSFVLIVGGSGSGKSSLCRCLNGLIPHFYGGKFGGKVEVNGLNTLDHGPRELFKVVGVVFQDPESQVVALNVEEEVAFGLENLGYPKEMILKRVEETLYALNITELRKRKIEALSGGELQKVAIASVLAVHPRILVLDEPTSELDPKSSEEVLNLLKSLNEELGITVILTEHRLERVISYADRVIVLKEGRVIHDGEPRKVMLNLKPKMDQVTPPPITELGIKLGVDPPPLTIKEGRKSLLKFFNNARKIRFNKENLVAPPIIKVEGLWFSYEEGKYVLRNVNLSARPGEFIAIMGRNGSGKTTLAKLLIGLLKPSRGRVIIDGIDVRNATVAEVARVVGYVPQNPESLIFAETVEEEVSFILKNLGLTHSEVEEKVARILKTFKIAHLRGNHPLDLSSGEKQRVALASITVAEPKVLILDEPTRGMDFNLKSDLMDFLEKYRKQGRIVIFISHDVEEIAKHATRVLLLGDGEVIYDGDKRKALSDALYFSPQINRLIQGTNVQNDLLTVDDCLKVLEKD